MFKQFNSDIRDEQTNTINRNEVDAKEGIMIEGRSLSVSQKVLFVPDLERLIGRNRVTLRRWWLTGKFPKPVKLNGTTLAWHSDEIEQWIDQMIVNGEKDAG